MVRIETFHVSAEAMAVLKKDRIEADAVAVIQRRHPGAHVRFRWSLAGPSRYPSPDRLRQTEYVVEASWEATDGPPVPPPR